jgi:hypothetical protein
MRPAHNLQTDFLEAILSASELPGDHPAPDLLNTVMTVDRTKVASFRERKAAA